MNLRSLALALLLTVPGGMPMAQQQTDATGASGSVGPETRAWVELQTNGSAASSVARPMPGDIADRIYQRHADSFAHPIPEELGRESFVGDGGGGSGK
jgi:hypothetical protein